MPVEISPVVRADILRLIERGWRNNIIAFIISNRYNIGITTKNIARIRAKLGK